MYKSFKIIDDFVKEIYGFNLIGGTINHKISKIEELRKAHESIKDITKSKRKPYSNEFVKYVYPLLEISLQWYELKKGGKITEEFLDRCKQRVRTPNNFYGTLFEIDMASRCLLSNWDIKFPEDHTKEGRQIDFIFYKDNNHCKVIGVECTSKRYTRNLTIQKINRAINDKAKKFKQDFINKLGFNLDEKLLIIDITADNYSTPKIFEDLNKAKMSDKLDAVIFTWREDKIDGENHSLVVKYKIIGDSDKKYFSTTYAAELRKGPVFFMRKYIEPEPRVTKVGPEE
jgi:hypothetical protein